jgi:glycosyltransferase involved in cell wall biosynthesis
MSPATEVVDVPNDRGGALMRRPGSSAADGVVDRSPERRSTAAIGTPEEVRVTRGTIAVVTYRRPADLEVIVPQLFDQIEHAGVDFDVLVVDNDASASAAPVLDRLARPGLRSVVEPEPGIAAARNRALAECADRELLVFVDDDESPSPRWLESLLELQAATGATGTVGAVVSEFSGELDPWIRAGRFFVRRRLPTGTRVDVAATNNLLLDLAEIRRMGLTFDQRLGLSGGSDTLFTRAIVAAGGSLVWCDAAVVTDRVPVQRMTRGWVLRRSLRMGNSWSRTLLIVAPSTSSRLRLRCRLIAQGLTRIVAGVLRAAAGTLIFSPRHQANGCRTAARGSGMLLGALGYRYAEYRRD